MLDHVIAHQLYSDSIPAKLFIKVLVDNKLLRI